MTGGQKAGTIGALGVRLQCVRRTQINEKKFNSLFSEGIIRTAALSASGTLALQSLAQFFIDESENGGGDAYDNEGGYGAPDGVGFGEFPNRQYAEHRADDQRNGNHRKCDPPNGLRVYDATRFGLDFDDNIRIFGLHFEIIANSGQPTAKPLRSTSRELLPAKAAASRRPSASFAKGLLR